MQLINSNKAPDSHGSKPEINSTNPSTNDKPTWPSLVSMYIFYSVIFF